MAKFSLKKIILICLTIIMAMSTFNMSAFAENSEDVDFSSYQEIVDEINRIYDKNIRFEMNKDASPTKKDLEKFKKELTEYAEQQQEFIEKSKVAEMKAKIEETASVQNIMENNRISSAGNATYSLTHNLSEVEVKLTATGTYSTSSRNFLSCSNVNATCTSVVTTVAGYSQRSYNSNIIDARRTLAVTSIGERWYQTSAGVYYDDNCHLYTEFYNTEL